MASQPVHPDTIYQLIHENAVRFPQADAIMACNRLPLNWIKVQQQVDDTLGALQSAGLGRGKRVAIVLPNGPEMAMTFLAVAAGMTAAPLNPGYRRADFDFYLEDLKADAVIVAAHLDSPVREVARIRRVPLIEVETDAGQGLLHLRTSQAGDHAGSALNSAADIALILHTSGTTSRPKMVPLSSANLCRSAFNVQKTLSLGPQDRCLNIMPLFHIHGLVANVLGSLAGGGSIVCTPGFHDQHFFDWYRSFQPSWFSAVPTMHQAILQAAHSHAELIAGQPPRFIRSSSASLAPPVMQQLENTFHCPVIEAYGMTEAAHQMASNPLPPAQRKPRSVGPSAGPEIAVIDKSGAILGSGQVGEVAIRGANVTSGYLANPAANAEAFCNGWFRTGDQGYLDEEGYLFLTGRLKEIINRGGEKIMPREIDEALMAHPAIHQAVAFAVPHPSLGEDVAVAVVPRPGSRLSAREVRDYAFGQLPDFKVPSQVVLVDKIPKGPTGKLQRIGLAQVLERELMQIYQAPEDALEEFLADIIAEVLKLDSVGTRSNVFALGADSLKGTQIISRINDMLDIRLPVTTLFRKPTIVELAAEVRPMASPESLAALDRLLAEIRNMSDEDAQDLLNVNPDSNAN